MKKIVLALVAVPLLTAAIHSQSVPAEVKRFIVRREACDYARGDIPDPSENTRLAAAIDDINRSRRGTDARLRVLKRKYRSNQAAMKKLRRFEDNIEAAR